MMIKHGAPERTIASVTEIETNKEDGKPKVLAHKDFTAVPAPAPVPAPLPEPPKDANPS